MIYAVGLVLVLFALFAVVRTGARRGRRSSPDQYGAGAAFGALSALAICFVPLGAWKFVEIVTWAWQHARGIFQ